MRSHLYALLISIPLLMTCAHEKRPEPVDVSALPPLPRSSIAAVVLRRAELGLTDEQVRDLEALDQQREKANAAILDEVAHKKAAQASAGGNGMTNGASAGGARGGGMRGGGMRGGGGRRGAPLGGAEVAHGTDEATVQDRLDENDTKSFLDAEQVLTEAQRDPMREIASDYRAKLYERRELERQKAAAK